MQVRIPNNARGFYSAALLVHPSRQAKAAPPINCTLVVPVLVEVALDAARVEVDLTGIDLIVPFTPDQSTRPRVRLTVANRGETLCCFNASVSAVPADFHRVRSDSEMAFQQQWIMPGARLSLETDYTGPSPAQPLVLHGFLDLIQEQRFSKTIPASRASHHNDATPHSTFSTDLSTISPAPTDDPAQTVAMLDYNSHERLHLQSCHHTAVDPFFNYCGRCTIDLITNFEATLEPVVRDCCPSRARWTASVRPDTIHQPTRVLLDLHGEDLPTTLLPGGQDNVLIAKLGLLVIPQIGRWHPDY